MNSHSFYLHVRQRSHGFVHLRFLHHIQNRKSIDDFPEDGILPVDVRRFRERDEKLTSIHIFPGIRHGHYPSVREFQVLSYFVLKHSSSVVNRFASFPSSGRVAALRDELLDDASENRAIVIVGGG